MKRYLLLFVFIMLCTTAFAEKNAVSLLRSDETIISQDIKGTDLAVLVEDNVSGCRYLRIMQDDGSVISSQPLNKNVYMDIPHSGLNSILLSAAFSRAEWYIDIRPDPNGQWCCNHVQLFDEKGLSLDWNSIKDLSSDLISPCRNDAATYGEWRVLMPAGKTLQTADFSMMPVSRAEAWQQLDTSVYAYVNNPNPSDRLHLRTRADKNAPSLGKFYNRTPVYVLQRGETWSLVYIGSDANRLTGYMMTKYLAFGSQKDSVRCAFPQLTPTERYFGAEHGPAIYAQPYLHSEVIDCLYVNAENYVIGVVGDEWLIIMTPEGLAGYCRASDFDEGNG